MANRSKWRLRTASAVSLLLAASAAVQAASDGTAAPAQRNRRVTSPDELRSLGFPEDAIVYIAPGAEVASLPTDVAVPEENTKTADYASWNGSEFKPERSGLESESSALRDLRRDGFWGPYDAHVQLGLPSGRFLEGVRWWGDDASVDGHLRFKLYKLCLPAFGSGTPVATILATGSSGAGTGLRSGYLDVEPDERIDNRSCTYNVSTTFDPDALQLAVQKVRAQLLSP